MSMTVTRLDLSALFLLGLFGTAHCLAMCGPLVLAFPARTGKLSAHLFYHLGRTIAYAAVGAVLGGLGEGLSRAAAGAGSNPSSTVIVIQTIMTLAAAGVLFGLGIHRLGLVAEPAFMSSLTPASLPGYRTFVRKAMERDSSVRMVLPGLLLGFLPCGLSYAAFARAFPAGGWLPGALAALAFALGTWPGLLLLGTGASRLAARRRKTAEVVSGLLMILMAAILLVRTVPALFG